VWNPSTAAQPLDVAWPGKELVTVETPDGSRAEGDLALDPGQVAVMVFRNGR
jgi:hypothetical protein